MILKKPSQWLRQRSLALLAAGLAALAVAAKAYAAYLPAVGPAPLRFRPDYKPAVHIKPAPLSTADETPAPAPAPTATAVVTPAPAPTPALNTNEIVVKSPTSVVAPDQSRPDGVVSPQMLLRYFNRPTNAPDAGAGLGFTPPPQADQQSSRATLTTPAH